ncbi:type IV pilin [Salinibaculum salinum]|uniref:type IV pilin n=1 Tax=Salinibaculum salinum TaxID=3131996 RepID=UPI0030EDF1D1
MTTDLGDRGVSEGAGLAALVLLTVVVTASVGVNVLFLDDEGGSTTEANFSFEHQSQGSYLLVTHQDGSALPSDRVRIKGPDANVTWAEVAGWNGSREVTRGDLVQLSESSAYGSQVGSRDNIQVLYVYRNGSTKVLDEWNPAGGAGDLG